MEPEQRNPVEADEPPAPAEQLVLCEFVFGREATPVEPNQRAERRRRAAERSRARVPYN